MPFLSQAPQRPQGGIKATDPHPKSSAHQHSNHSLLDGRMSPAKTPSHFPPHREGVLGIAPPRHIPTTCCMWLLMPSVTPLVSPRVGGNGQRVRQRIEGASSVHPAGGFHATPVLGATPTLNLTLPFWNQSQVVKYPKARDTHDGSGLPCTKPRALQATRLRLSQAVPWSWCRHLLLPEPRGGRQA